MTKQIDLKALLESKMGAIEPVEGAREAIERAERAIPKNLMYCAESTEFKPVTEPMAASVGYALTVEEAKATMDAMDKFIETVLISGTDYGIIPHCSKPSLLKSGAEKALNYLGLIARTVITNRMEDYTEGFFAYECKVYLVDYNGVVKGEGIGTCNTKEPKYIKSSGFASMNTVLKMAKKRALVDATLNVGALSARFTQDVEDMNLGEDTTQPQQTKMDKPASQKQLAYLTKLMLESNTSSATLNRHVKEVYGIEDYHQASAVIVSELIAKFQAAARR